MAAKSRARRSTRRVTMTDVAKLADVSASTVSLYIRKPDEVSGSLGRRIQSAIDTLGYVPNLMAGALAAAKTRVVGVVVPSMVNSIFATTVNAMQTTFREQGYQLLLGYSAYSDEEEEALVRTFLSWSPSAMVLTGLKHTRETRKALSHSDIPVVEMWELGSNPLDSLIGFSHLDVGKAQARHLMDMGCQRIAFIGARMEIDSRAGLRAEGYTVALKDFQNRDDHIVVDVGEAATAEASSRAFGELLDQHPEVDGIIFSNDLLALGATFEAQRRGIAIPRDVAVIGFGDMDFSSSSLPRISTVRPPREQIGRAVAEHLLARINGESPDEHATVDLGFDLIQRESSAVVPEGQTREEHHSSVVIP